MSQTNNNLDIIDEDLRFKFVDDATVLEIINLLSIGMASHNAKLRVPNEIAWHNQVIPVENLRSQDYLKKINDWSISMKMELNLKKTKTMTFNYSKNHQFSTNISLNEETIEDVRDCKLLGTLITHDLKWEDNTQMLTKRAYSRMQILYKIKEFNAPIEDQIIIYKTFVRCLLEFSCQVWHSMLTKTQTNDLERVQKCCLKLILDINYKTYKHALIMTGLETLEDRREMLCLRFANNCLKSEKTKNMFPLNEKTYMPTRQREKFTVNKANTERYKNSAIPYMQRLLNNSTINYNIYVK